MQTESYFSFALHTFMRLDSTWFSLTTYKTYKHTYVRTHIRTYVRKYVYVQIRYYILAYLCTHTCSHKTIIFLTYTNILLQHSHAHIHLFKLLIYIRTSSGEIGCLFTSTSMQCLTLG